MSGHYKIVIDSRCDEGSAKRLMQDLMGRVWDITKGGTVALYQVQHYTLEKDIVIKDVLVCAESIP